MSVVEVVLVAHPVTVVGLEASLQGCVGFLEAAQMPLANNVVFITQVREVFGQDRFC